MTRDALIAEFERRGKQEGFELTRTVHPQSRQILFELVKIGPPKPTRKAEPYEGEEWKSWKGYIGA